MFNSHYNSNESAFGCLSASTLFHAGCAALIVLAPELGLLPEGTEPFAGDRIEFTALDVSQGQQIITKKPQPHVADAETNTESAPPAPLAKPEPASPPKPDPAPVVATEPIITKPATTTPPPPEPVAKIKETQKADTVAVRPTEPPADVDEAKDLAQALMEPDKPTPQPDIRPIAFTNTHRTAQPKPETFEETQNNKAPPSKVVPLNQAQQPAPQNTPVQRAGHEYSSGGDTRRQAASDLEYGVPTGNTRSYLDLRQRPGNVPPQYPTTARRQGWEGEVRLIYYVTAAGQVRNLKLMRSSGYEALDQEAVRAISQYRYMPGQAGWTTHPVYFSLKGPTEESNGRLRTSSYSGEGTKHIF